VSRVCELLTQECAVQPVESHIQLHCSCNKRADRRIRGMAGSLDPQRQAAAAVHRQHASHQPRAALHSSTRAAGRQQQGGLFFVLCMWAGAARARVLCCAVHAPTCARLLACRGELGLSGVVGSSLLCDHSSHCHRSRPMCQAGATFVSQSGGLLLQAGCSLLLPTPGSSDSAEGWSWGSAAVSSVLAPDSWTRRLTHH
jgi:hypothetical protein